MKYLILVSHGDFAIGLKNTLAMFVEEKSDQVMAFGLKVGASVETFAEDFRNQIKDLTVNDDIILLADIVGGSPLTTALEVLSDRNLLGQVTVLGGMNLPMAVTSLLMKDELEGAAFVETVLFEARNGLQEFQLQGFDSDELEEDI
ncbi:PTS sugar transporter subunit IIA [Streptococcus uberis]|uniref:Sugar phosphotransferase system (PTS), fructose-specific family, IIA component n=2 Tax=Streptococcus uberis TaxID=1349 RepID=B9DT62_STRU0|nr:PTS fructose transporter subunit IIA [Streptococcus uberis]AUC24324.1 PTS fructose transporter subunit IIA [Streptococcus uberis]KKF44932.1 PTS fructose transporter subunit IIA [Streptococcus uberis C9359]KKF45538.1 PTS fructose transporter subunit IIA [Streptococcus uberis Ab71]KKF50718.1 PTS fructose transporter subunit IIA [Streptococcus uberis C8329]KKF51269.1 PTS fructose transporter subunit IIA [Streptococcus uberis S6261]